MRGCLRIPFLILSLINIVTAQSQSTICPSNCISCSLSTYCTNCKSSYYQYAGSCISCGTGCDSCTPSYCSTCKTGYYKYLSTSCRSCPTGCQTCSGSTYCYTCKSGYTQDGYLCKRSSRAGTVVGSVGGSVATLFIVLIVIIYICYCQKKKQEKKNKNSAIQPSNQISSIIPISNTTVAPNQNEVMPLWDSSPSKPQPYVPYQPPMQNITISGHQPSATPGNGNLIGYGDTPNYGPTPRGAVLLSGSPINNDNRQQAQLPPGFI